MLHYMDHMHGGCVIAPLINYYVYLKYNIFRLSFLPFSLPLSLLPLCPYPIPSSLHSLLIPILH